MGYCKLNSTAAQRLKVEAAVENKELSRFRLSRRTTALLFLVGEYRCIYQSWEEFIPGKLAER
jgi:hypothetical protein